MKFCISVVLATVRIHASNLLFLISKRRSSTGVEDDREEPLFELQQLFLPFYAKMLICRRKHDPA